MPWGPITVKRHPRRRPKGPTFYTTQDIAEHCAVSLQTVQDWVKAGRLLAWRTPGTTRGPWRISEENLRAFLRGWVPRNRAGEDPAAQGPGDTGSSESE